MQKLYILLHLIFLSFANHHIFSTSNWLLVERLATSGNYTAMMGQFDARRTYTRLLNRSTVRR